MERLHHKNEEYGSIGSTSHTRYSRNISKRYRITSSSAQAINLPYSTNTRLFVGFSNKTGPNSNNEQAVKQLRQTIARKLSV
ncbi:hypothetical protein WN48_03881 [Eufriesea mexicana]|nr:hypothetical protein WN48_03881 [Eufriesea mexicana]